MGIKGDNELEYVRVSSSAPFDTTNLPSCLCRAGTSRSAQRCSLTGSATLPQTRTHRTKRTETWSIKKQSETRSPRAVSPLLGPRGTRPLGSVCQSRSPSPQPPEATLTSFSSCVLHAPPHLFPLLILKSTELCL